MSMLSAQCDELRAMAESVGMAMPQAATLMMEAADTIWELRCRLVDAEVRVRKLGELCKLCEREDENAKLRKLLLDAWGNGHPDKSCGDCEIMDECHAEIEEARKKGNGRWNTRCLFERRIEDRMRELGIEVDG